MAPANKGKKQPWGYVDINLNWVIEPQFAVVGGFHEGLAAVAKSAASAFAVA